MKELELKLSNRAKQLRYYVNECEKLKNAFVKIKEKENAVEGELNLAKCRLKNSDDTVEVLLKAIDDLNVKKNSLYQEMASLTAGIVKKKNVIDIPAFSLRPGPCQLILFKSHITRPGTRFAINSTLTESIKCVPFPIYRTFAYHVTDIGVEKYRNETNRHKTPNTYLTQQRLYQNTAVRNKHLLDDDTNIPSDTKEKASQEIQDEDRNNAFIPAPEGEMSPLESSAQLQPVSSLPPPPRAKRTKSTFPTGFASLDTNYFAKDFLPNILKGTSPTSPNSNDADAEMPIILNLLPPNGRFWWLNNIFEETHNT
ncbi:hypothetical protein INT48_000030 [Thamnidium elegans]|uniref:Uncharacterized protein n=1 Tax=Thamnidium elegans TaxID=101142 RepID=A0A8H7VPM7_9FUNG|nr:hypothetical protein INT48_000030 [Thamnidium elegans]